MYRLWYVNSKMCVIWFICNFSCGYWSSANFSMYHINLSVRTNVTLPLSLWTLPWCMDISFLWQRINKTTLPWCFQLFFIADIKKNIQFPGACMFFHNRHLTKLYCIEWFSGTLFRQHVFSQGKLESCSDYITDCRISLVSINSYCDIIYYTTTKLHKRNASL